MCLVPIYREIRRGREVNSDTDVGFPPNSSTYSLSTTLLKRNKDRKSDVNTSHAKGQNLCTCFVKIATVEPQNTRPNQYWPSGLQSFGHFLQALDLRLSRYDECPIATISKSTQQSREEARFSSLDIHAMNKRLPLRQGIPRDARFDQIGPRRCAGSIANTPLTEGRWGLLQKHLPMFLERLCQAYDKYRDLHGRFCTQDLIDTYTHRVATEGDGCWWCYRDFPGKEVTGSPTTDQRVGQLIYLQGRFQLLERGADPATNPGCSFCCPRAHFM